MCKCVNDKCNNDPLKSMDCIIVTCDGDMACCSNCKNEYEKQRNHFFDNIGNNDFYNNWMKA